MTRWHLRPTWHLRPRLLLVIAVALASTSPAASALHSVAATTTMQQSRPLPACAGTGGGGDVGGDGRDQVVGLWAVVLGRWVSEASVLTIKLGHQPIGDTFQETLVATWAGEPADGVTMAGGYEPSGRVLRLAYTSGYPRRDKASVPQSPLRLSLSPDGRSLQGALSDGEPPRTWTLQEPDEAKSAVGFSTDALTVVRQGGAAVSLNGETAAVRLSGGRRSRVQLTARSTVSDTFDGRVSFQLGREGENIVDRNVFVCFGVVNTAEEYWDSYRYVTAGHLRRNRLMLASIQAFFRGQVQRFLSVPTRGPVGRLRVLAQSRRVFTLYSDGGRWTTIGTQSLDFFGNDVRVTLAVGNAIGQGPYGASDVTLSGLLVQ